MKRKGIIAVLVSAFALLGAAHLSAQEINLFAPSGERTAHSKVNNLLPGNMVYRSGDLYIAGQRLSDDQVLAHIGPLVYNDTYEPARRQYNVGLTMVGVGAGVFVGGIALCNYIGRRYVSSGGTGLAQTVCVLASVTGFLAASVGVPILAVGAGRLRWVASDYNERRQTPDFSMKLGACPNGIGLSLVF